MTEHTKTCRRCRRKLKLMANGTLPYHVIDPTVWRGTWCAGSGKNR